MLRRATIAISIRLALGAVALAQSVPDNNKPAAAQPTTQPPGSPESAGSEELMDPPMLGDHWTYDVHDEITGELKFSTTNLITDLTPTEVAFVCRVQLCRVRHLHLRPRLGPEKQSDLASFSKRRHRRQAAAQRRERVEIPRQRDLQCARHNFQEYRLVEGRRVRKHHHRRRNLRYIQDRDCGQRPQRERSNQAIRVEDHDLVCAVDRSLGQANCKDLVRWSRGRRLLD